MDVQLGLEIADIRLLQTWHLLRGMLEKLPDREAIEEALESIRTAREIITNLRAS